MTTLANNGLKLLFLALLGIGVLFVISQNWSVSNKSTVEINQTEEPTPQPKPESTPSRDWKNELESQWHTIAQDSEFWMWLWVQLFGLLITLAFVYVIMSLFITGWGPRLIVSLLILAFLGAGLAIYYQTPPGVKRKQEFLQPQQCNATGDCGQDIPTYTQSTMVRLNSGDTKENPRIFNIAGKVPLYTPYDCNYPYIEWQPTENVRITHGTDVHITYIEPSSGDVVRVHVWLLEANPCPRRRR